MIPEQNAIVRNGKIYILACLMSLGLIATVSAVAASASPAKPQAKPGAGAQLDVSAGTKATYRVKEQLAGISFPDDAVGSTDAITGSVVILPDGSVDSSKSKLTIDLKQMTSDQAMRDNYIKRETFQTDKFPNAEFVARKLVGVAMPIPAPDRPTEQSGFQLIGDLTVHGVTKEVTLNGYATFSKDLISGRAVTEFTFATFGLPKPTLARLLSVDDKIQLEIDFKLKRS